ncbi:MAG: hypothetical protein MI717_07610 [Spirochaetales bacterium]|nr:hypothetical protein [Spirochaetales bacterium]
MKKVKAFTWRTVVLLIGLLALLAYFGHVMGFAAFFSTVMATSHDLLLNTVFFIMGIAVVAGALGGFLAEFGILALLNRVLAPVVRLLWGLPGAASVGAITTFISDNPAIIALGKDQNFIRYFEEYQKPALTNFGTSFGMGLIVIAYMMSLGYFSSAIVGFAGALVGSVVSTRLMLAFTKKSMKNSGEWNSSSSDDGERKEDGNDLDPHSWLEYREIKDGPVFRRFLESLLDGGSNGLKIGMQIVPGVLVICTMVLLVTMGPGESGYDGSAYQGIPLLSGLGRWIQKPLEFLFGFTSPDSLAFPVTALGAVGAAMALVPRFLSEGLAGPVDVAVFTAMGMTWSGFLSTHIAMMDVMGFRSLTGKAMLSHTVGGICAGVAAHYLFRLTLLFL